LARTRRECFYSAVAEILGIRISGFPAWLLWRAIYLAKLPSLRQKVRIALDWFFVLLFPSDFVQMRVVRDAGIARQHLEAGEVIFFQGDLGDNLYVIEGGECDVLRETNGLLATHRDARSRRLFWGNGFA